MVATCAVFDASVMGTPGGASETTYGQGAGNLFVKIISVVSYCELLMRRY